jgi:gliding motility-associated-like protein
MKRIRYILYLLFLLTVSTGVEAQYINRVCAGDSGIIYRVGGTEGSTFNWKVEGGRIVSDWGDSISVAWGDKPGEFELWVQETSEHGCPAIPVSGTVLVSAPVIDLGNDLEICEGESAGIDAAGEYYSYRWNDGSEAPYLISSTEGYKRVTVTDQFGCEASDSIYLTVNPLPEVNLGPDTALCGIEEALLDAGPDGVLFNWSTGEKTREIIAYSGEQTIWVEVINEFNCIAYDTVEIEACSPEDRFAEMPTAFTPNGDGKNDVWRIPELEPFPNAVVEIYDRWGNQIYRSEPGYSDPWDGVASDGRTMPMDSYYFVINLNDGSSEPVAGTVTIIK